jgi:hypothetical protein
VTFLIVVANEFPMLYRRALSLMTLAFFGTTCVRRTERGFGRCTFIPQDTLPLPEPVIRSTEQSGELRVVAHLRNETRSAFGVSLRPNDSTVAGRSVTVDSVAVFRALEPGRYTLRVSALGYSSRVVTLEFPRGVGRFVDVYLRYGGVSLCEDGPR